MSLIVPSLDSFSASLARFFATFLYIACIFIIPDQATVTHQQKQQPKSSVFDSSEYTVKDADKNDRV